MSCGRRRALPLGQPLRPSVLILFLVLLPLRPMHRDALPTPPRDVDLAVLPRCLQVGEFITSAPGLIEPGAVEANNPALVGLHRPAPIALVDPFLSCVALLSACLAAVCNPGARG